LPPLVNKNRIDRGEACMGILWTLIVGGIVGWLASMMMKTNAQMGMLANIVVGIVGSVLGGWLFGLIGFMPTSSLASLVASVIGAMVLIAILKSMKVFK
jgi:uncharacterized membrane protein YeaQ/YmgE (transglycosylase-associated protein family)